MMQNPPMAKKTTKAKDGSDGEGTIRADHRRVTVRERTWKMLLKLCHETDKTTTTHANIAIQQYLERLGRWESGSHTD